MKTLIICLTFLIFSVSNYAYSLENKILFKINNKIITSLDIYDETQILKLLNKNISDLDNTEVIKIASNSKKNQTFKEVELLKYNNNLDVPQEYLNSYLTNYSKKIGFNNINEFKKYCKDHSIDFKTIKKKIIVEILWSRLIYEKFFSNVKVNEQNIRNEILKNEFINEYLLLEIIFNVENKNNLDLKFNAIKKSIENIGFEKSAFTYSIASTSENGGNLGWIKETALSSNIKKILKKTGVTNYTNPIQIPGGFLIFYIKDIKKTKSNLDIDEEIKNVIKSQTNKQLNQFSNMYLNRIKKNLEIDEF
tara:strand:+ start:6169 stop:7089 length:921 start_codon:yes stop_codon:yes gene_type:complete